MEYALFTSNQEIFIIRPVWEKLAWWLADGLGAEQDQHPTWLGGLAHITVSLEKFLLKVK